MTFEPPVTQVTCPDPRMGSNHLPYDPQEAS